MNIATDANLPATTDDIGTCFVRLRLINEGCKPAVSERSLEIANAMLASINDDYHNKRGFLSNSVAYFNKHGYYKGFNTAHSRLKLFLDHKDGFIEIMDGIIANMKKPSRKEYVQRLAGEVIADKDFHDINDYFEGKDVSLTAMQTVTTNLITVRLVDDAISYALAKFKSMERLATYLGKLDH